MSEEGKAKGAEQRTDLPASGLVPHGSDGPRGPVGAYSAGWFGCWGCLPWMAVALLAAFFAVRILV